MWPHRLGEEKQMLTTAGIDVEVDVSNFHGGKMRVACVADIYRIYSTQTEVIVDEERPRLASVLGTRDSSSGMHAGSHMTEFCGNYIYNT